MLVSLLQNRPLFQAICPGSLWARDNRWLLSRVQRLAGPAGGSGAFCPGWRHQLGQKAEKKFTNLKSHDCHVLMTELLPVVLRGILPDNVRLTIVKLCAFLNAVSQKIIDPENLIKLQNDVTNWKGYIRKEILCLHK